MGDVARACGATEVVEIVRERPTAQHPKTVIARCWVFTLSVARVVWIREVRLALVLPPEAAGPLPDITGQVLTAIRAPTGREAADDIWPVQSCRMVICQIGVRGIIPGIVPPVGSTCRLLPFGFGR